MTCAPSDRVGTLNPDAPKSFWGALPTAELWPQPFKAVTMSETLGRPRAFETRRRTKHLLALLAEGCTLQEAAESAKVKPDRVLRLLDEPEFRTVVNAILDGRAPVVAVAA